VPIRENRAEFSAIERVCPSQASQPFGAKLPAKSLISARMGSIIFGFYMPKCQGQRHVELKDAWKIGK
jgi:hypothetical protein